MGTSTKIFLAAAVVGAVVSFIGVTRHFSSNRESLERYKRSEEFRKQQEGGQNA